MELSLPSLADIGIILLAGLTSGVLDITCTLTLNKLKGSAPVRTLQTIASGLAGPKSFESGRSTAALGLGLHFLIAVVASAAYYLASRRLSVLIEYAVLCGLFYGIGVHLFMSLIVLPLSSLQRPFSGKLFTTQLIIHMFFVGLPISLIVRLFACPIQSWLTH
jgi:uncharacterized membrane protein YagU involved in acid resistance